MAVTITVDDVTQPTGELMASFFPENDMTTLVVGWISQAASKVAAQGIVAPNENDAALAWVYYRAYQHVSLRLESDFASKNISSGAGNATIGRTTDQRKFFIDREQYWYSLFNSYNIVSPIAATPSFFGRIGVGRDSNVFVG